MISLLEIQGDYRVESASWHHLVKGPLMGYGLNEKVQADLQTLARL